MTLLPAFPTSLCAISTGKSAHRTRSKHQVALMYGSLALHEYELATLGEGSSPGACLSTCVYLEGGVSKVYVHALLRGGADGTCYNVPSSRCATSFPSIVQSTSPSNTLPLLAAGPFGITVVTYHGAHTADESIRELRRQ